MTIRGRGESEQSRQNRDVDGVVRGEGLVMLPAAAVLLLALFLFSFFSFPLLLLLAPSSSALVWRRQRGRISPALGFGSGGHGLYRGAG